MNSLDPNTYGHQQAPEDASHHEDRHPATTIHSLSRAIAARKSEYVRPHQIRVKIGIWNVAACPGTEKDLRSWFIDGKGIDQRLAGLGLSRNSAVNLEQEQSTGSDNDNPDAVRLIGGDKIGLYVLGLQEVIDLNLTRTTFFTDPEPRERWTAVLTEALPEGYELIVSEQLSGILLLIFASAEVASTISNVNTVATGTGLLGYMGNKGALATRIMLGETTRMVFINSHLASGSEASNLERRCWDYNQILSRTQFAPINNNGVLEDDKEKIGDEDFIFWLGDLNFRLDNIPGDDIRRLLELHTRGEYDITKKPLPSIPQVESEIGVFINASDSDSEERGSDTNTMTTISTRDAAITSDDVSEHLPHPGRFEDEESDEYQPDPSSDPVSLQATIDSLLPHDQLKRMMKEKKIFHDGWREGPITFLPTYKYDVGTIGQFDSSEKRRAPSWCDRILFRTRKEKEEYEINIREQEEAKIKDTEMKAQGMENATDEEEVLFNYDPESDGEPRDFSAFEENESYEIYDEEAEEVTTKDGYIDKIRLDIYTAHQRITSSDHKPVVSIFTLEYDAVVPNLKAKVHAEIVRALDRAENEGRPGITIVIDGQGDSDEGLDFGPVSFMKNVTRTFTIANTSQVPAILSFGKKPTPTVNGLYEELPPWLTTGFARTSNIDGTSDESIVNLGEEVTLEPGDTITAILDIYISTLSQLNSFNSGLISLEDVLILQVLNGRDHFIPFHGTWLPTCFGRSIEELIRLPSSCGGIRNFEKERPEIATSAIPYSLDIHTSHPRELFRLIETIENLSERVVADESILSIQSPEARIPREKWGWPFDVATHVFSGAPSHQFLRGELIDALDCGATNLLNVFPAEISSVQRLELTCEVLDLFLRSFIDGIVTAPLFARIEASLPNLTALNRSQEDNEADKAAILDILATAPNHNISFVFLVAMLGKVISELAPLPKVTAWVFKGNQSLSRAESRKSAGTFTSNSNSRSGLGGGGASNRNSFGAAASSAASVAAVAASNSFGGVRRSLSLRRSATIQPDEVIRRIGVETEYARVLGRTICRTATAPCSLDTLPARERREVEARMAKVVEVFFARP